MTRSCYAQVNLDHVVENAQRIKALILSDCPTVTTFFPVVKASGYGQGITEVVKALYRSDPEYYFSVATLSEALLVRVVLPQARILILAHTPDYQIQEAVEHGIALTVSSLAQAEYISKLAKKAKTTATIHVKVDTGMHRLGFPAVPESISPIGQIFSLENLVVEGLYTHFATAYFHDKTFVHIQAQRFRDFKAQLTEAGVHFPLYHVSNSGILLDNPEYHEMGVRFGSAIFGVFSSPYLQSHRLDILPTLSVRGEIAHLNPVPAGEGISYDHTYTTTRDTLIGVVSMGWTDWGIRLARNQGSVLIGGQRCPIVGCVCMDQMMIDVTDLPEVAVGDRVTLLGKDQDQELTIEEVAEKAQQDTYALSCSINQRLPIVYLQGGKEVGVLDLNTTLYQWLKQQNDSAGGRTL